MAIDNSQTKILHFYEDYTIYRNGIILDSKGVLVPQKKNSKGIYVIDIKFNSNTRTDNYSVYGLKANHSNINYKSNKEYKSITLPVHYLVALAFIPKTPGVPKRGARARFLDGDTSNITVDNIVWINDDIPVGGLEGESSNNYYKSKEYEKVIGYSFR
jgi:hypothetical protein